MYVMLSLELNQTSATTWEKSKHRVLVQTSSIDRNISFLVIALFLTVFPVFLSVVSTVFFTSSNWTGIFMSLAWYKQLKRFTPLTDLPKTWSKCQAIISFSSVYSFSSIVSSKIRIPSFDSTSRTVFLTNFQRSFDVQVSSDKNRVILSWEIWPSSVLDSPVAVVYEKDERR